MANLTVKILLLFVILFYNISAQQNSIDTTNIPANTIDTTTFVMHKSPWGAVLRSAVIPGWGQIYNESYWKAPIVWGFIGFYAYYWKVNNDKYIEYKDRFRAEPSNPLHRINRDNFHDQRDLVALYMGITYFLNLVDAYVDAQLFDFTVEENSLTKSPMLNIRVPF